MLRNNSIDSLPNTRPATIQRLKSIGINTYWDLLNYFPFRYENFSLISTIDRIQSGEVVTIRGKVLGSQNVYAKTGLRIQKIILADLTGKVELNWYNQPYLIRTLRAGMDLSVSGEVKRLPYGIIMEPKEYEVIRDIQKETIHTGRYVPIYSEKNGLSSRVMREKIFYLINYFGDDRLQSSIADFLPSEVVSYNSLFAELSAYQNIHFPKDHFAAKKARERLAFDELFVIQLSASLVRKEWEKEKVVNIFMLETPLMTSLQNFINNLPFPLTNAQNRVVNEIISDLKKPYPMNRFLEGDVGSGKTVVAAIACYLAHLNGYRSLIMAPTEILAQQHFQTISVLFKNYPIDIGLQTQSQKKVMTSSRPSKSSNVLVEDANIIVGTHALISKKFSLERVGLVVIDEQHRFGVSQRAMLKEKGINPHLLTMTATPIPRTVALTLYGELDLSVIDEMPKGRLPVSTFLVPKEKRISGYDWIKKKIKTEGTQAFIICPLIEQSEIETMKSVKAATREFERLKNEVFTEFRLGLLHGKVKSALKDTVMEDFKKKKIDILVATPVVEVGIDVPNATIMMIEAAERFGLAQLHQLRGRVGRGDKQSYCLLYTESVDENVLERLRLFTKTQNGMKVAEYDLKLRGPGDIYGTRQHGIINLKIASMSDFQLIDKSKRAVNCFLSKYSVDRFQEIKRRLEEYRAKQISRD